MNNLSQEIEHLQLAAGCVKLIYTHLQKGDSFAAIEDFEIDDAVGYRQFAANIAGERFTLPFPSESFCAKVDPYLVGHRVTIAELNRQSLEILKHAAIHYWRDMQTTQPKQAANMNYSLFHSALDELGVKTGSSEMLSLLQTDAETFTQVDQLYALEQIHYYMTNNELDFVGAHLTQLKNGGILESIASQYGNLEADHLFETEESSDPEIIKDIIAMSNLDPRYAEMSPQNLRRYIDILKIGLPNAPSPSGMH